MLDTDKKQIHKQKDNPEKYVDQLYKRMEKYRKNTVDKWDIVKWSNSS